jgi:hypothetical protein
MQVKRTLGALRGAFNKSSSQQTNVKGSDPNMTEILRGNLFDGIQNSRGTGRSDRMHGTRQHSIYGRKGSDFCE